MNYYQYTFVEDRGEQTSCALCNEDSIPRHWTSWLEITEARYRSWILYGTLVAEEYTAEDFPGHEDADCLAEEANLE